MNKKLFNEKEFSREEKLIIWLRREGLSYAALGRLLGITRMSALRICKAEEIDIVRYAQLIVLGVPQELLPKIKQKRGEKNKIPVV